MRTAFLSLLIAGSAFAQSPHARLEPVAARDVTWTAGFWTERFAITQNSLLPNMTTLMHGTERSHFLHNFRIAAGDATGKHRGAPWNDGDTYKWLEAVAHVYAVSHDAQHQRILDEAIAIIANAQRADGYLHTPVLIANRNGEAAKPFHDRLNFEMYNFGHLFTAACVHHEATGSKTLLNVAIKAADFLVKEFTSPSPELARNNVCPSHYMGILDLYRTTGDQRYLALAIKFQQLRDVMTDGTDDNQDRIPFRQQTEAVGHAVRANYLYAGAADLVAEAGDQTLMMPLQSIWQNVTSKKLYITGACGALYDGASPDGIKDQKSIARVHQAFGRNYQLPNSTAHNETCAAIGSVLWNERMLRLTGDAKYAELMEHTLLNAVLAGVSLDGKRFFYTNTLRQLDDLPSPLRWSRQREEWISCYCCPPNVARMMASVHRLAYSRSAKGVSVNLFGGSTLDTKLSNGLRVKLRQETAYPWDGEVRFTLESAGEFSVFVRVPSWVDGATVHVNGEEQAAQLGQYVELRRTWAIGDRVELRFPMRIRMLESHPLVEETRNQVAFQRGPIVYCLESVGMPSGTSLPTIAIPHTATYTAKHQPKLLGGITTLHGPAVHVPAWTGGLYRERSFIDGKSISVILIPYFAWGNRGRSEMSVWLPIGR
jgi:uncharacterized protein